MSNLPLHRTAQDDEIDRLKAQLKETEEKGRVLMDMCRDLRVRATRLSEALQVAVDTPELGGGTWYDMAVAALDEQAGGEQ